MRLDSIVVGALCAAGTAMAHIEMTKPYAIKSQFNPDNSEDNIDYDNTSPLDSSGGNFPCRGHHNSEWIPVETYSPGSGGSMTLSSGATHKGGSCQLSLSYDNGGSFQVIKSMIGGCPLTSSYSFNIPSDAPSGKALFAWTWFNLEGNREMYMNCAMVEISGGAASSDTSSFAARPNIFTANIGNGCATVENKHTVFANPGEDVSYSDGLSASDPAFPSC